MSSTPEALSHQETHGSHSIRYDLHLAWRNLTSRPVQSIITIVVVALAIALFVAVSALNEGVQRGIIKASDPFGMLVVGAKGSAQQLVLSTLLLQGTPVGNIDRAVYEELREDPRVSLAVPLAMGDNVGGARIIGTDESFFSLSPAVGDPPSFVLNDGRLFAEDFEAVLGSRAAVELGLGVGDQFLPSHGVEAGLEDDKHDLPHTVVGILQPSNTPFDNSVLTTIGSVYAVHGAHGHEHEDLTGESEAQAHEEEEAYASEEGDAHADEEMSHEKAGDLAGSAAEDHAHAEDPQPAETEVLGMDTGEAVSVLTFTDPDAADQVTAVLIRPTGFIESNELWRELRLGTAAQAAFPGRELGGLFDLLNQGQQVLTIVGYLAAVMAALTVLLAIYSATAAREQTIAIMRGLGAQRGNVFRMVLFEALILTLIGAIVGRLLGYGVAWLVGRVVSAQSAIPISIRFMPELEPFLWLLPLVLGMLAGLLPAIMAYRVNVVEKLFPT